MTTVLVFIVFSFFFGVAVGRAIEKRKSDRKIAAIVAERLLRKPEVPSSSDTQANLGQMQQLAGMANQSMFSGLLGSAGSSQGFSGGSKLQEAITYAMDKVE